MAVCFRKRHAPTAESTPRQGTGPEGRRPSRFRRVEELQPDAAGLHPTTTTPVTADADRHQACVLAERSLAKSSASAAAHDAAIKSRAMVPVVLGVSPAEPAEGSPAAEAAELPYICSAGALC